jgi:hypothetical protein
MARELRSCWLFAFPVPQEIAVVEYQRRALRGGTGLEVGRARDLGCVEHGFTHRTLRLRVYRCETPNGRVRFNGFDAHRWMALSRIDALSRGAATKKAVALVRPIRP